MVVALGLASPVAAQPPAPPNGAPQAANLAQLPKLPAPFKDDSSRGPLDRPVETPVLPPRGQGGPDLYAPSPPFTITGDPPSGFTGPSGVEPTVFQTDGHFVPVEDRWRLGFPRWDRYDKGFPPVDDYPYEEGNILNPFKQNVLKGDYPIIGQNTFLEFTGTLDTLVEARQLPTNTTGFESTVRPGETEFFGNPNQFVNVETLSLNFDLFHGDAGFKQPDWRVVLQPTFSASNLSTSELGVVSPDVTKGTVRERTYFALQQWFVEKKIADLSPDFDILSVRIGSQPFNSDFRGFIFNDVNRGLRIFGNLESNRDQFNLVIFDQLEKDTNTQLNTFGNRRQEVLIGNFYRQDFIWPGYTVEASIHYNHDSPSFKFDRNGFLVRPDPAGVFAPHSIDAVYFGLTGDGHINRFNIDNAFYFVTGRDSKNPIANQSQNILAEFAALELSYDRDYVRFRASTLWSSGDGNPNNRTATGFDSILDNPNFAGTEFSYFFRQGIPLFGVNLKQRLSLIPDLRASKIQGQSNFVNPGLYLANVGFDVDVTQKIKMINNFNLLWFDKTAVLEQFVFQGKIDRFIGGDISTGIEYRPLLSNNVIMLFGIGTLIPGKGFADVYDRFNHPTDAFVSAFGQLTLTY